MFANCLFGMLAALPLAGEGTKTKDVAAKAVSERTDQAAGTLQESKPVRVKDVEFRVVMTSKATPPVSKAVERIALGLKITNLGKEPLQFELFETFEPRFRSAGGKVFEADWEREETCPADPMFVGPGKTETFLLSACLVSWSEKGCCLAALDGSGGEFTFEELLPGKYLLSFAYRNAQADTPHYLDEPADKDAPYWVGEVVTNEVEFEICPPKK